MARPKQYQTRAEKQAAYRSRIVIMDRKRLEQHEKSLLALQKAVWDASERGDEFARKCRDSLIETMLQRMIVAFNEQCPKTSKEV